MTAFTGGCAAPRRVRNQASAPPGQPLRRGAGAGRAIRRTRARTPAPVKPFPASATATPSGPTLVETVDNHYARRPMPVTFLGWSTPLALLGLYTAGSIITFAVYGLDKRAAIA